jgi:hypothetical protein
MLKKINLNSEIESNLNQIIFEKIKINQKKYILTTMILNDMIYMLHV